MMDTVRFDKKRTLVIAHRGLSGIERENTNAAFVAAGNRSYYGIETDLHRTSDGKFVIIHDGDLRRVAGEHVIIEQTNLCDLLEVVLFDTDGSKSRYDLRVSTLENYLSICKKYGKRCILELKSEFSEKEIAHIIRIIKEQNYLDDVTFISFCYDNLLKVRRIAPEQSAQYLFFELTDELVDRLTRDRIDVDVQYQALTRENVQELHERNLKVNCWTVDQKEIAEQLSQWGVDYITTNILE